MTQVSLRNITKTYPNGYTATKNISLEIEPGEFLVLVGPSGCGKSTLLRMIAGLEDISGGQLLFDGEDMTDTPPAQRDIGMVFQNYALYPHLTVYENIAFPLRIKNENKAFIDERVREVASLLGLETMLDRRPKELSGGQRQRVALGRAIVRKPRVFLFDEPLSNLDAQLRVQMRTEILSLQRTVGSTAVYVTHDQTEAMTMGDRIVVLRGGEIQQAASPEEIYNNPANEFVAGFIGSPQINLFRGIVTMRDGKPFFSENDSDISFALPEALSQRRKFTEGEKVTLGIRPEHLHIVGGEGTAERFAAQVEAVEYVGHETLVYFRSAASLKCVRSGENVKFSRGETIQLSADAANILAFDATGMRI